MNDSGDYQYVGIKWALIFEWAQLWSKCDWFSFHPASAELVLAPAVGRVELSLILAGVGFVVRWNYAETPLVRQALRTHQNINDICAWLDEHIAREESKDRSETLH